MTLFEKKYVGLDFHDYSAQIVELRKHGDQVSLEQYNRVLIPPSVIRNGEILKEEELKQILNDLFLKANPKPIEKENVAMILPASKVLTHIFTFPAALDEKEIAKALPYEMEKVMPVSIDDVYWDFTILEKEPKIKKHASQHVFFAAIMKSVAEQYTAILEAIDIVPTFVGVHSEAIRRTIAKHLVKDANTLVIDIGTLSVNFLYVESEILKSFLSVNEGGHKLLLDLSQTSQIPEAELADKKEKTMLNMDSNMETVQSFIEKNYAKAKELVKGKVDNVVLTGEFLNLPSFYTLAKKYFPNQTIEIGDPKVCLEINPARFIPQNPASEKDISIPYSIYFVNAIGIALLGLDSNLQTTINLLPDRLKESLTKKKYSLFITILSIALTAISLFAATFLTFKYQEFKFDRLELEIQKSAIDKVLYGTRYQEIRDEIVAFNSEVNALSAIENQLFSIPDTIDMIQELIPQGISISTLKFNDESLSFEMNGVANNRDDLLKLKENLTNAEFIKEVISPISNYDEESKISFLMKLELEFSKLNKYGSHRNSQ